MSEINKPDVDTWYILYNVGGSIYHYGLTTEDQVTTSDFTELETFTVEQDYLDRLAELGIDPDTD